MKTKVIILKLFVFFLLSLLIIKTNSTNAFFMEPKILVLSNNKQDNTINLEGYSRETIIFHHNYGKYKVEEIFQEHGLSFPLDFLDKKRAKEIGKSLGVDYILYSYLQDPPILCVSEINTYDECERRWCEYEKYGYQYSLTGSWRVRKYKLFDVKSKKWVEEEIAKKWETTPECLLPPISDPLIGDKYGYCVGWTYEEGTDGLFHYFDSEGYPISNNSECNKYGFCEFLDIVLNGGRVKIEKGSPVFYNIERKKIRERFKNW